MCIYIKTKSTKLQFMAKIDEFKENKPKQQIEK